MNIPNLLQDKLVDENGYMHPGWFGIFTQLITEMKNNLSNEGFVPPGQPTSTISTLEGQAGNFALIGDTDSNTLKVHLNGVFKTIQTL